MMPKNKYNALILAAVAGLMLVIGLLIASTGQREAMLLESAQTRQSVEQSFDRIMPETIESVQDEALLSAARSLAGAEYVARLWVVDNAGRIVFHDRGPGHIGDDVRQVAGRDGRSLVAALSADEFSGPQAVQMYTAAALMAEGDHNDVYRPLVRPLFSGQGRMVGAVGISYEVSPAVGTPSVNDMARTAFFLLGLAAYWLALPLWTLLDARQRGEPAVLWSIFVLVANLVGLIAYLITIRSK